MNRLREARQHREARRTHARIAALERRLTYLSEEIQSFDHDDVVRLALEEERVKRWWQRDALYAKLTKES